MLVHVVVDQRVKVILGLSFDDRGPVVGSTADTSIQFEERAVETQVGPPSALIADGQNGDGGAVVGDHGCSEVCSLVAPHVWHEVARHRTFNMRRTKGNGGRGRLVGMSKECRIAQVAGATSAGSD